MVSNYANIDRVGSLDAGFQQVPLVQKFWNFHYMVIEHRFFKISEEKQNIFPEFFFPKIQFTIEIAEVGPILAINLNLW